MSEISTSPTRGPDAGTTRERSRLSFDLDVDICVVGAGLAGLTVALEAARLGASVAVLEGRHVGWGASGHQFGTVMPGYGLPVFRCEPLDANSASPKVRCVGCLMRKKRPSEKPR